VNYLLKRVGTTTVAGWLVVVLGFALLLGVGTVGAATITETKPGAPVSLSVPDTELLVQGCVAAQSLVTISDDNTVVGTDTSNADGLYSRLLVSQTPTIHVIDVFYEDPEGVVSDPTSNLVALPTQTTTVHNAYPPPTVNHSPLSVEAGQSITFRGYTCPGATVSVVVDNSVTYTAVAGADGLWTLEVDSINFTQGVHAYRVSAAGPGYATDSTLNRQFTVVGAQDAGPSVDTTPAEALVDLSQSVEILTPDDGFRTNTRNVLVSGVGPANAQVELYADGVLVGSVFTNAFGEWSLVLSVLGTSQVLEARACSGSRCGQISEQVEVFYVASSTDAGECRVRIRLQKYRYTNLQSTRGIDITLEITEGWSDEQRYDAVIDWGDLAVDHHTVEAQTTVLHHTYSQPGHYNGTVSVGNDPECRDTVYFSVEVVDRARGSNTLAFVSGFLLFVFLYVRFIYTDRE